MSTAIHWESYLHDLYFDPIDGLGHLPFPSLILIRVRRWWVVSGSVWVNVMSMMKDGDVLPTIRADAMNIYSTYNMHVRKEFKK